ncbi:MAG: hypothetical protein ACRD9R_14970 [Pyrinomonadaceae bacterium]
MKIRQRYFFIAAGLALICAAQGLAQQADPNVPAPDNFVTHTSFKNRVFEVRHRDPESIVSVVKLLTSGYKGASVSANRQFKTITVRDFPENIASIEEALKRLDTPEATRPDIELRMHVLLASNAEGTPAQLPADLKGVVTQLQSTLNFKNYQLLTTVVQRTKESVGFQSDFLRGSGAAELTKAGGEKRILNYEFRANSLSLVPSTQSTLSVQLGGFQFEISGDGSARIRSDVGLREGEQVVVGTSSLNDKALVLVISAKLIK